MTQISRSNLQVHFQTGKRPTESNFTDLIESCVNIEEDKATNTEAQDPNNNDTFLTPKTGRVMVNPLLATKEPLISLGNADDYWTGSKTFQNLATKVRDVLLTGFALGADTAVTATDKIMEAFGKLQAQINTIKNNYRVKTQYVTINVTNNSIPNSSGLQKMFNSPASGAFALTAGKKYRFTCNFSISSMSSTSGTFSFGFKGGTGTGTIDAKFHAVAVKIAAHGQAEFTSASVAAGTSTELVSPNTETTGNAMITGIINCSAAGSLIPAVALSTPAAAIINKNSYFEIEEIGDATSVSNGPWS